MKIKYHKNFIKSYRKKDNKIRLRFQERLEEFTEKPFSVKLNNHSLLWKYKWKRSINISWDYRAIFKELSNNTYEFIEFTDFWTHSELY